MKLFGSCRKTNKKCRNVRNNKLGGVIQEDEVLLTIKELENMKGLPVCVCDKGHKYWAIVDYVFAERYLKFRDMYMVDLLDKDIKIYKYQTL